MPTKLSRADRKDELQLAVAGSASPADVLQTNEKLVARVDLKDGRVLDLQTTVEKPRPKVEFDQQKRATRARPALPFTSRIKMSSRRMGVFRSF